MSSIGPRSGVVCKGRMPPATKQELCSPYRAVSRHRCSRTLLIAPSSIPSGEAGSSRRTFSEGAPRTVLDTSRGPRKHPRKEARTSGPNGICHAYTPDGRCVSLLKVLLTNFCVYDCLYCVNRNSSNVPRARFSIGEVVDLTLDFYKRNYVEGLFLSSGIIKSPDYTMEQLVEVARRLREEHGFRGYVHLKTIPDADPLLVEAAGRLADRLST